MTRGLRHKARNALALGALMALGTTAVSSEPLVLAAASTNRALSAALEASGLKALTSYAASGVLARQIAQGAPADLYVSANHKWMTHLVETGAIAEDDVAVLMSNRLVLIAPPGGPAWSALPLRARLDGEVFVMADPASAPVGSYGKAALEHLGLWDTLGAHFVPMRNTLATVATVASGEAQLGLVYASDAAGQPVDVLFDIPTDSHPPIAYLIAPLSQGSDAAQAGALLAYLRSPAGQAVLADNGFVIEGAP